MYDREAGVTGGESVFLVACLVSDSFKITSAAASCKAARSSCNSTATEPAVSSAETWSSDRWTARNLLLPVMHHRPQLLPAPWVGKCHLHAIVTHDPGWWRMAQRLTCSYRASAMMGMQPVVMRNVDAQRREVLHAAVLFEEGLWARTLRQDRGSRDRDQNFVSRSLASTSRHKQHSHLLAYCRW